MSSSCTPILVGGYFGFGDMATFSKTANFPFRGMDYSPWSSHRHRKNHIDRNRLKKFMQVGIDATSSCTPILILVSGVPFKNGQISLSGMDYSPWSSKNLMNRNWLKRFMQVGIDVKNQFWWVWFLWFRNMATFKNDQISLSGHGL